MQWLAIHFNKKCVLYKLHGFGRSNSGQDAFYDKSSNSRKKKGKKKKMLVGEKQSKFPGTLNFFLAFVSTFMLKTKLVEKLAHYQGNWLFMWLANLGQVMHFLKHKTNSH